MQLRQILALAAGTLVLSVSALGCGSSDSNRSVAGSAVSMGDYFYRPGSPKLKVGSTVSWKNVGKIPHTVKGPGFQSRQIDAGQTFTHKFTKAGEFKYICTFHPTLMDGKVTIK